MTQDLYNIPRFIIRNSSRFRDRPFLTLLNPDLSETRFTYLQLLAHAADWMAVYARHELAAGSRIIIMLPHSIDLYASYTGALMAGCIPAMFAFPSPKFSYEEYTKTFAQLLANADPDLVVTHPNFRQMVQGTVAAVKKSIPVCDPLDISRQDRAQALRQTADTDPHQTAFLQYSSGTTGIRKGVAVSQKALLWQIEQYAAAIRLTEQDRIVSWLPLYHDMGLICCYFLPLLTQTPLVAMSPFDWVRNPSMLPAAVTKYRSTLCWLPNFAYNFLARQVQDSQLAGVDLSSLRGVINCSEPVLAESHRIFLDRFSPYGLRPQALGSSYAMAENTFAVTSGGFGTPIRYDSIDASVLADCSRALPVPPEHPKAKRMASSGTALPQTAVEIRSADGRVLPERHVGEIVISSPCLFQEYYKNPQAAQSAFKNGWFYTGDLGYLADGHLYVTGRLKDLIIIAGKNIYPQDLEQIINTVEGVIPGRCVALGAPDEQTGTEKLILIAESNQTQPEKVASIKQVIYQRIAAQTETAPGRIHLVPHGWLLKSSSGKIARRGNLQKYQQSLQAAACSTPASTGRDESTQSDLSRLLACINSVLSAKNIPIPIVRPDQPLISSGLIDSLSLVSLIVEIEKQFSVSFPPDWLDLYYMDQPQRILEAIRTLRKTSPRTSPARPSQYASVRDQKTAQFLNRSDGIDMLILGSSKSRDLLPPIALEYDFRAYNFWVRSCRAEDWYCISRFVLDHNRTPLRHILLGIDIESFSNAVSMDVRLLQNRCLRAYLDPADQNQLPQLDEVLLPSQETHKERFQNILLQYKHGLINSMDLYVALDSAGGNAVMENRNPLHFGPPLRDLALNMLRMKGFTALQPRRIHYFLRLIDLCRQRQIQITCFLTPLHRDLHEYLSANSTYAQRLADLRLLLRQIRLPGFLFLDTPTPDTFDGREDDFKDEAHMGPANADLFLRWILTQHQHAAPNQVPCPQAVLMPK